MRSDGKTLAECVAEEILSMIVVEKRFQPGNRIPNETDFSKELFVSRSTFREAVKILSERGILEARHGSGTYISSNIGDLYLPPQKSGVDAIELNELRLMIEPEAAYFAALRASENELKRIQRYSIAVEEKVLAGADRRNEEIRFPLAIVSAVHNGFMNRIAPAVFDAIDRSENVFNYEEVRQGTILDHRMIVRYLKERNADSARTAMRLHMLRGIQLLKDIRSGVINDTQDTFK